MGEGVGTCVGTCVGACVGASEGAKVGLMLGASVGLAVCFTKYKSVFEGIWGISPCAGVCSVRAVAGSRASPPPTSCAVHGPGTRVRDGN